MTVQEVMVRHPKVLPASASLDEARLMLSDDHVHIVLLNDGPRLVGTLTRGDLPSDRSPGRALTWSTLIDRTVLPDVPAAVAQRHLVEHGLRRLAVVDDGDHLMGLLCLKRRMTGFCSDSDVDSRASGRPS